MFCKKNFYFVLFVVINFVISRICAEEDLVEILREKVVALEDSLTLDIRLLRQDIKKNSEEFSRVSNLLDETLSTLNAGELQPIGNAGSQTRQLEVMKGFSLANLRLRRAFAEEKAGLKRFTSSMKNEIDQISNEISNAFSDLKSNIETKMEGQNNLEPFKNDLIKDINHVMTDLATNLTISVKSVSSDIAKETSHVVSAMQKTSENITAMIPDIMTAIKSQNRIETPFVTPEQLDQIRDQFMDNFDTINDVLKTLKESIMYSYRDVRLVNIVRTQNTIEGRLEVRQDGQWGTVCDDRFDMNDARVACRMLGFSSTHSFRDGAFYGRGVGPIWLDDLVCSGAEESLFDCGISQFGHKDCGHSEDIGVKCNY